METKITWSFWFDGRGKPRDAQTLRQDHVPFHLFEDSSVGDPQSRGDLARTLAFLHSLSEKVFFQVGYHFFQWSFALIKHTLLCMGPDLRRQIECLNALSFVDYDHVFD